MLKNWLVGPSLTEQEKQPVPLNIFWRYTDFVEGS